MNKIKQQGLTQVISVVSHFEYDGMQNYLVFQPVYRYFKNNVNNDHISLGKSQGLSDESIKPPAASNISLAQRLLTLTYEQNLM